MRASAAVLGLCLGAALSQSASADILKFNSNTSSQNFNVTTNLILNSTNGATLVSFKKTTPGLVVVRVTGECLAQGPNGSYASITIAIRLKGESTFTTLPPSGNDQSFCAPGNNNGLYWVSAAATGALEVPAGKHGVRVTITPNSTTSIRIDDLAVTVEE